MIGQRVREQGGKTGTILLLGLVAPDVVWVLWDDDRDGGGWPEDLAEAVNIKRLQVVECL